MNDLECHVYDSTGKEIICPKGHVLIYGNGDYFFHKVEEYKAEFVYQPERLNPEAFNNIPGSLVNDSCVIDLRDAIV